MFDEQWRSMNVRRTGIETIARLAETLQVPVSAFGEEALSEEADAVGGDGPTASDLELADVLDRMTDDDTRLRMQRLLRRLEAGR